MVFYTCDILDFVYVFNKQVRYNMSISTLRLKSRFFFFFLFLTSRQSQVKCFPFTSLSQSPAGCSDCAPSGKKKKVKLERSSSSIWLRPLVMIWVITATEEEVWWSSMKSVWRVDGLGLHSVGHCLCPVWKQKLTLTLFFYQQSEVCHTHNVLMLLR